MKEIFDNLEIVYLNNPQWKAELSNKIKGEIDLTDEEEIKMRKLRPLMNILDLIKDMGCNSIVIENEYIDEDYLAEYSSFYSKVFRSLSPKTQRLHFFTDLLTFEDLKDLSGKGYLGFTAIRPTISCRTSRTILTLRSLKESGTEMYLLCRAKFPVNLSGSKLIVEGTPFIQQDSNIGVCAEAAIWMCSLYMHQKYQFPRFRIPTITRFATRYLMIGPPRAGLITYQMLTALRDLGYSPLLFSSSQEALNDTVQKIYSYVESEIPVILLISIAPSKGHAVAVVGHSYNVNANISSSRSNIDMINAFYLQDDACGPYRTLTRTLNEGGDYSIVDNVEGLIVPLLPEIVLQIGDVTDHFFQLIIKENINKLFIYFEEEYKFSKNELDSLIFRTYLRRSNDFKTSLPKEMNNFFKLKYKAMRMPKYIWVIELSTKELIKSGKIVGEIILDSTSDRHAYLDSFLAIHLYGRMIIRKPDFPISCSEFYYTPEESSYSQLRRPKI